MQMYKRFINISLRALTLVSRFVFIFFLAKFLQPSSLGEYGLFTASVGYVLYFVGLDFYIYTTRELLKNPKSIWGSFIKNQIALSSGLYFLLLVILGVSYETGLISAEQTIWFFFILLFEHINQEFSRLFVAINNQTLASILLFIRQGLWALVVILVMAVYPSTRNLTTVLMLWFISGILAFLVSLYHIKVIGMGGWKSKVDYKWIANGIKTSALFLVATLSLKGTQTIDRFWIQSMNGLDIVGAYVLYIGMTGALMAFLDAGVFTYSYPALIRLNNEGKRKDFKKHLIQMAGTTIAFITFFIIASLLLMPYLLAWTEKQIYFEYIDIYKWLLVATALNALSMIPHYVLYAKNYDRPIIYSHLLSVLVFTVTTWLLSRWNHVVAVPIGLCSSFLFILIWKAVAYYKINGKVY